MKTLKIWLMSLALTTGFAATAKAELSDILSSGTVKIAIPENFPPFGALGIEGEYEGYDVDVAKLIAADLGVELELVPVTSKQRIPFLETDKVDLVIATMGANPGRAKSIWFSSAYAPFFSGAFAASGLDISSPADLAGLKVGLTGGTLEDLELTESAPDGTEIIRFGDNAATRAAYLSGQIDVLVTGNLFGDILSDIAAMLTGSIGMLPSASLNADAKGLYEPVHGSATDIAGTDSANPLATILSAAMLLRYSLNAPEAAAAIEGAVASVLARGLRTADLIVDGNHAAAVGTRVMGDAVVAALRSH